MKAIFLDRDGVINKEPGNGEYVKSWEEFEFLPGVKLALKRLDDHGFTIVVISNQAGVSKGLYSEKDLERITRNMLAELSESKIKIKDVYYCMHQTNDNCDCRKPKTGLIELAASNLKQEKLSFSLADCYFVGDTIRDIETGRKAGLKTILVFSGKEKPENKNSWQVLPDFTATDLSEAVELVLKSK
ncbi:MAG: HAD family hydrolase [Candidatus Omnitrophica bacterium]|nr:HAD family hydrolase [Candidatus Omnitrophota bacterium]